jgi:hypothetical protein
MKTMDSYLERKYREVSLLNSCLASPLYLRKPDSVGSVIEQKFRLAAALKADRVQHGLYLTLSPMGTPDIDEARSLAGALSGQLERNGRPVRHAGSFGFDFVAIEWFHGSSSPRNLIRVAASDLPPGLADWVAQGIATWWSRGMSAARSSIASRSTVPLDANVN